MVNIPGIAILLASGLLTRGAIAAPAVSTSNDDVVVYQGSNMTDAEYANAKSAAWYITLYRDGGCDGEYETVHPTGDNGLSCQNVITYAKGHDYADSYYFEGSGWTVELFQAENCGEPHGQYYSQSGGGTNPACYGGSIFSHKPDAFYSWLVKKS